MFYNITENYTHRLDNSFFDDTPYKDEYQDDVYAISRKIKDENNYKITLDIGCGSGYKLIKYFSDITIVGVDIEPTVTFLKINYPDKTWCEWSSLDKSLKYDLIICSDVIEHIPEPNAFLKDLNSLNFNTIVFSTPDRLNMYKHNHLGPPSNPSHVREWTMPEFYEYISTTFDVIDHLKSSPESNTQIIVCKKKNPS